MTVQVFLAGGVQEVMLHLRGMGVLDLSCLTATGNNVEKNLEDWEKSERRKRFKEVLYNKDEELGMMPSRPYQKFLKRIGSILRF